LPQGQRSNDPHLEEAVQQQHQQPPKTDSLQKQQSQIKEDLSNPGLTQ
jgi:hypothetical protein